MLLAAGILVGAFYIIMGVGLIKDFKPVVGLMVSKGVPQPAVMLAITIVIWLACGVALLANTYRREAALVLLALTVIVSVVIHNFWTAPPATFANEMQHFLKNVAICGALLALAGA